MNTKPNFLNPWAEDAQFIALGDAAIFYNGESNRRVQIHDLYALVSSDQSISFGARYGDDGPDYVSGEAFYNDAEKRWNIYGPDIIQRAAALYFANHHYAV